MIDRTYGGVKLYIPKENQIREDDWRYFQGMILVYSPKWINGFSFRDLLDGSNV